MASLKNDVVFYVDISAIHVKFIGDDSKPIVEAL